MTDLTLRGVTKSYGEGAPVLRPFDLHVKSGELIVLVGPSGCGKSTLLKLIAGLEKTDDGSIVLGERDITALEPRHRRIAMVFQNYALYPHLSVRENLAYPLRRAGDGKAEIAERVDAVAGQLRLDALLDRRPSQLSGGQKQRVAMGRAIIRKPDLFLLDEPLSNLDAALRTHVRGEIRDLQRRLGTTMIYVTHDQVEAQTMADRLVIMRDGVVQQMGAPREIYAHPANMFAASFLGAAPPNYLLARVDPVGQTLSVAGQSIPLFAIAQDIRPALVGRDSVFLGIRPENLRPFDGFSPQPVLLLRGKVHQREHLGHSQVVYFVPEGVEDASDLVTRLSGRQGEVDLTWFCDGGHADAEVALSVNPADLMFFDMSGQALTQPIDAI